jgi:hypothetical protein
LQGARGLRNSTRESKATLGYSPERPAPWKNATRMPRHAPLKTKNIRVRRQDPAYADRHDLCVK